MNGHLVAKHFVSIWTGHQGTFLGTTRSSKLLIGYRGMTVIDGLVGGLRSATVVLCVMVRAVG